jgi:hypothetical protein
MLVLLDQGTPVPLRSFLKGHTVKTAAQQRWSTLSTGDLLRAAEAVRDLCDELNATETLFSGADLRSVRCAALPRRNARAAELAE